MPSSMFGNDTYFQGTPSTQNPAYDFSGLQATANFLKNIPSYKPSTYKPYQFNTPTLNPLGDKAYDDLYKTSSTNINRAARNAGEEQMRMFGQDLGGRGISSAARGELAFKNKRGTAADVAAAQGSLRQNIDTMKLQDQQTVRDSMWKADQERQLNQSADNFRAAGFDDTSSKFMSDYLLKYADQLFQFGSFIPEQQMKINDFATKGYGSTLELGQGLYGY